MLRPLWLPPPRSGGQYQRGAWFHGGVTCAGIGELNPQLALYHEEQVRCGPREPVGVDLLAALLDPDHLQAGAGKQGAHRAVVGGSHVQR